MDRHRRGRGTCRTLVRADPFHPSVAGQADASAQYRAARPWGALALGALGKNLEPGPYVTLALVAIAVYFLIAGVLRKA